MIIEPSQGFVKKKSILVKYFGQSDWQSWTSSRTLINPLLFRFEQVIFQGFNQEILA